MPIDPALAERIADLEDMVADDPEDALTLFLLASEYVKAERHVDAVVMFRRTTGADPDYSAAWAGLGAALEALQDAEAHAAWQSAHDAATRKGDHQVLHKAEAALARFRG